MDVHNNYGLLIGAAGTILASIFTFFNKQKLEASISLYKDGNDELRQQLLDIRKDRDAEKRGRIEFQAKYEEQSKLMERQADFTTLSRQLATNHKEQMEAMTHLAEKILDKS